MDEELIKEEHEEQNLHEADLSKEIPAFKFAVGEEEFLRLEQGGHVYVKGALVAEDVDVYLGFKSWLQAAQEFTRKQFADGLAGKEEKE